MYLELCAWNCPDDQSGEAEGVGVPY